MELTTLEAKVVVLGSQGVGKTSFVIRFVGNMFNETVSPSVGVGKTSFVIRFVGNMFSETVSPTIGASFFTYKMTLGEYRVKLQVWDTAGQERFRAMAPMYYRNANAALLMYDITCMDSYRDMKQWITELQRNVDSPIVMCVIGNKQDLVHERVVSHAEAADFSYNIDALFYETSALTNAGVEETFLELGKQLVKMYEQNPHCGLVPPGIYGISDSPTSSPDITDSPSRHSLTKSPQARSCNC